MADPDTLIKAKIHYYCREKQFHSMQYAAVEGMKRFRWDRDIVSGHSNITTQSAEILPSSSSTAWRWCWRGSCRRASESWTPCRTTQRWDDLQ